MQPTKIDVRVTESTGPSRDYIVDVTTMKAPEEPTTISRRLVWNLALIALIGSAIVVLITVYTDAASTFSAVFGVGGTLAWLALIKGLLPEHRQTEILMWVEKSVLMSRITPAACAIGFLVLALYLSWNGVVVLDSTGDGTSRLVTVRRPDTSIAAQVRSVPNGKTKIPLNAFPGVYYIETRGLPFVPVDLTPFSHITVYTPTSFEDRPLTIVRVDPALAATDNFSLRIRIARNGHTIARTAAPLPPLLGRPIWIGCASSVTVPPHTLEFWKTQSPGGTLPPSWQLPPSALLHHFPLQTGDTVTADLLNGDIVVDTANVTLTGGEYTQSHFKEIYLR